MAGSTPQDLDIGQEGFRRRGGTRQQPPTAEADEEQIELANVLDQLQHRGAVAGHHLGVVVGRDQGRAQLGGDALGDGGTVLRIAVVEDDRGAVASGRRDLGGRRVRGHDDRGWNTEKLRRKGHCLGVVAGGVGDDTVGACLRIKRGDGVVSPPELEGADALERLGLEEGPRPDTFVEGARGEHRRVVGNAAQALGGGQHVVEGDRGRGHRGPLSQGHRIHPPAPNVHCRG